VVEFIAFINCSSSLI